VSTTVLLLPEFLPDLVEDDAVVLSFNDLQIVVRTPRPRTLLAFPKLGALGRAGSRNRPSRAICFKRL